MLGKVHAHGLRRERADLFRCGAYLPLTPTGPREEHLIAFAREHDDDIIVCVNNLSRFPQPVELDLRRWEGWYPVELLGGVPFPTIGELPYLLTLGGHSFYWFRLTRREDPTP